MTDTFKSFVDSMTIDISKPRTYEETTAAIERLAQQRLTPIPAEPVIITISTPTVWPADPYPPIHVECDPHDSNRIIASGPGVDLMMLKLAASKPTA